MNLRFNLHELRCKLDENLMNLDELSSKLDASEINLDET